MRWSYCQMGIPVMVPSMWTCGQPGPQGPWIMLSHSVREAAVAIYGFLSLSNTHIFTIRHQKQTRPRIQPQSPPQVLYFEIRWQAPPTVISEYVRHLQTIFIHKLIFRVEEDKAQFCTLFVICIYIYAIIHVEHVELDKAQQRPLLFMATTLSDDITFMLTLTPKAKLKIRK